jgi:phosphoribosylformylglycinamidine synthase subunit PurS
VTTYLATVEVRVRHGVRDPQGEAIAIALRRLGDPVGEVTQGKLFTVEIEADDVTAASGVAERIAGSVLSNPLMEDATVRSVDAVADAVGDAR